MHNIAFAMIGSLLIAFWTVAVISGESFYHHRQSRRVGWTTQAYHIRRVARSDVAQIPPRFGQWIGQDRESIHNVVVHELKRERHETWD